MQPAHTLFRVSGEGEDGVGGAVVDLADVVSVLWRELLSLLLWKKKKKRGGFGSVQTLIVFFCDKIQTRAPSPSWTLSGLFSGF